MSVNGLTAVFNMPAALKSHGKGDDEMHQGLPPHHPRKAFLVDAYPACPPHWMRSTGRIKSYFVAVREDRGLWLDFNDCLRHTGNHVAVVVSAQGVNAITGLPCKDAALEQYRDNCPKHKKPFGADRFCPECNFKWPKQNYLCSTGTPQGGLWIDGFRTESGVVRQYVFTSNETRSVAKAILGEDRVFAIGISYFLSKEPRPQPVIRSRHLMGFTSLADDVPIGSDSITYGSSLKGVYGDVGPSGPAGTSWTSHVEYSASSNSADMMEKSICSSSVHPQKIRATSSRTQVGKARIMNAVTPVKVKNLEIAAGAKISQHIYDDPMDLTYWQQEPEGLIVINYASEEDVEKILAAGKVDLDGSKEGFVQKMPVGN